MRESTAYCSPMRLPPPPDPPLGCHCCKVALRQSGGEPKHEALLWWLLAFGLVALGINKQLDLQTALTEFGRILATRQGWYERRHEIQLEMIYTAIALGVIAAIALAALARKAHSAALIALVGSVFLMTFIIVRAASFHHVDVLLKDEYFGLKVNWILELGGIAIVIAGACWRLRAARDWRAGAS